MKSGTIFAPQFNNNMRKNILAVACAIVLASCSSSVQESDITQGDTTVTAPAVVDSPVAPVVEDTVPVVADSTAQ